jgi:hypothetical protein
VAELRVVHGDPTAEELAALVTVLAATRRGAPAGGAAAVEAEPASRWRRSARPTTSLALRPGPGAWRASALPGG